MWHKTPPPPTQLTMPISSARMPPLRLPCSCWADVHAVDGTVSTSVHGAQVQQGTAACT
jgi:hypothetical protein